MSNPYEDLKKMISDAERIANSLQVIEQREKAKIAKDKEDEFNRRYQENLAKLKATGIVEIFEELVSKEVVVMEPAGKRTRLIHSKNFWGKPVDKSIEVYGPVLAKVNIMPVPVFGKYVYDDEFAQNQGAGVCLIFDKRLVESNATDSGLDTTHSKLEAKYYCDRFILESSISAGENLTGIGKSDLIKKVGEKIMSLKGLNLPDVRK